MKIGKLLIGAGVVVGVGVLAGYGLKKLIEKVDVNKVCDCVKNFGNRCDCCDCSCDCECHKNGDEASLESSECFVDDEAAEAAATA